MINIISVIIINYKNWSITLNCIESIKKNLKSKYKLIIIDNYSNNGSDQYISEFISKKFNSICEINEDEIDSINSSNFDCYFIKNNSNYGYALANNIGLNLSYKLSVKYSLIINSDVIINNDFISEFIHKIKSESKCAIISPIIRDENKKIDNNCLRKRRQIPLSVFYDHGIFRPFLRLVLKKGYNYFKINFNKKFNKINIPSGSCFFVDINWFKSVNFFDENTFLYEEEHILFEKVLSSDKTVLLSTNNYVIHLGQKSSFINSIERRNIFLKSFKLYMTKYRSYNNLFAEMLIKYIVWSEYIIRIFKRKKI